MIDKYNQSEDFLSYLRSNYTGEENSVPSAEIERIFGISGVTVRQIVNKLRCEGQPVCSDVNGYYYAKTRIEINNTVTQLLSRTKKINAAAQGLIRSLDCKNCHIQSIYGGTEG